MVWRACLTSWGDTRASEQLSPIHTDDQQHDTVLIFPVFIAVAPHYACDVFNPRGYGAGSRQILRVPSALPRESGSFNGEDVDVSAHLNLEAARQVPLPLPLPRLLRTGMLSVPRIAIHAARTTRVNSQTNWQKGCRTAFQFSLCRIDAKRAFFGEVIKLRHV